jgi:hypothetical protein
VVLFEAVEVMCCATEVNVCVLRYKMALCEFVQVGCCTTELKGCVWRCTGGSV